MRDIWGTKMDLGHVKMRAQSRQGLSLGPQARLPTVETEYNSLEASFWFLFLQ